MKRSTRWSPFLAAVFLVAVLPSVPLSAQPPPAPVPAPPLAPVPAPQPAPAAAPAIEDLGEGRYRIGELEIDQPNRRVSVPGKVTDATVLEYLACAEQGFKAYESALELMASAEGFNLAMLMIGLDAERAVPSRYKFDPETPQGDEVEIWIEWSAAGERRKVSAAELIYDREEEEALAEGRWVYTGSVFYEDGTYAAALDGVLIGFMHTPESIIDSALPLGSSYGAHQVNPELGLAPGMPVRVTVENRREEAEP